MKKNTVPRLVARFGPEWPWLTVVVLFIAIGIGLSIAGPLILAHATNILFDGIISKYVPVGVPKTVALAELRQRGEGDLAAIYSAIHVTPGAGVNLSRLGETLGLAAVVYLLAGVAGWAQAYIMAGVAQRIIYRLRQEAEEKLAGLPLSYFDSRPHGEVLSLFTNDVDNLAATFESGISQLMSSLLTVFGVIGIMFWISPVLAAVSLVTIPVAVVASAPIASRTRVLFEAQWERTGDLNALVEETHSAHTLVMAFGQREPMIEEFNRQNEGLRDASFRAEVLSGAIGPTVSLVGNLNFVVIAALGGFQVATGTLSLGSVQALIQYSRQFTGPITEIASQMNLLQSGLASAKRVFEFLDAPEEAAAEGTATEARAITAGPSQASRRVQLQNVSFRYDPATPLIEDFTLDAAPGQTVAIVGPTGAGKTTIVNLLVRFYEIDDGHILLDGVDYRDLSRAEVRRCFGMVLQDTWLFAGTIWDNIAYGRQDASDEDVRAAARAAYVDRFVLPLPDGYATVLDGEASSISSGQKQLLTIARAFLANPDILILDEATSNVDTRTEVLIQNAMTRLRAGRTSFVIAHRLSTIRDADTIVVMDAGRIAEQGSHAELLSRRGFYHHLYNSQFAGVFTP